MSILDDFVEKAPSFSPIFVEDASPSSKTKRFSRKLLFSSDLLLLFALYKMLFPFVFFVFYSSSHFSLVFLLSYSEYEAFNQAALIISTNRLSGVFGTVLLSSLIQCSHFFNVFESHVFMSLFSLHAFFLSSVFI